VIFTESRFLFFFLIAFSVYWTLPRNRPRKVWLLVLSYIFYASWDWRFLWLILLSTVADYFVGRALEWTEGVRKRKWLVAISLVVNLGFLGLFKYYDFFVDAGAGLFDLLGWEGDREQYHLNLILPVGISFYTFQTLSYTIDVYRRKMSAVSSFLDFALFVGFFPQLVAGPIVRATQFLPQLADKKLFRDVNVRACLTLFFFGFIKKAVISDNIAPITDQVFANPGLHDTLSNWIAVLMWHVQEYCDFSGYSDMAIATAGLLGYRLPINFNFPYFAKNIGEFWRRWHITLSTWFRDYLYVSIGGSRGSLSRGIMTGCITMLLVGVWHGAGWQHAGFGILMCGAIVIARLWGEWVPEGSLPRRTATLLGPLIINYFLFINWIVFRAESWDKCMDQFGIFLFLEKGGPQSVDPRWVLVFILFAAAQIVLFYKLYPQRWARMNDYVWAALCGGSAALVLALMATDYQPFVYFHF
jgi:alginate O-acetyltransferase complex protein AlgI